MTGCRYEPAKAEELPHAVCCADGAVQKSGRSPSMALGQLAAQGPKSQDGAGHAV